MIRQIFKKGWGTSMGVAVFVSTVIAFSWAEEGARERVERPQTRKEMIKAAKEELDNTTWKISLRESRPGRKAKLVQDTLRFADGRIVSEMLSSEGFSPTNFTVRIKGEDIIIWETMQSSEDKGLAFWRGEIRKDAAPQRMRGVLSRHLDERKIRDYTFVSEKKEEIIPEGEEKEAVAPVVQEAAEPIKPSIAAERAPAAIEIPAEEEYTARDVEEKREQETKQADEGQKRKKKWRFWRR